MSVEPLADRLDRVDVRQARAVVAVVELLEARAQLLLALAGVPHTEVGEPAGERLDVLGRRIDEEPGEAGHVEVGEPPREAEVDQSETAVVEVEDVRRMRVAVEERVPEDHRHPRVRQRVGELAARVVVPGGEVEVADVCSLEPARA